MTVLSLQWLPLSPAERERGLGGEGKPHPRQPTETEKERNPCLKQI